jgi:hypothetical protein
VCEEFFHFFFQKMTVSSEVTEELVALQGLWKWASENGANLLNIEPIVCLENGEIQRTVVSTGNISNLQEIAVSLSTLISQSIPECILLSETRALKSQTGICLASYFQANPDLKEFHPNRAKGLIALIVFMVYERFQKKESSFFYHYLSTLPKDFPSLPFFFSENELDTYIGKDTNLVKTVRSKLVILEHGFEIGKPLTFLFQLKYLAPISLPKNPLHGNTLCGHTQTSALEHSLFSLL